MLFLYPAFLFLAIMGSGMIQGAVYRVLLLATTGSMIRIGAEPMSRIKAYLAYSWAALAVPLVLVTFMGMQPLAGKLVAVTGLRVHPIYTGGEIARTIDHGQYQTLIHRPVFDGLIGQRNTGFVQIKWQPKDANLPAIDRGTHRLRRRRLERLSRSGSTPSRRKPASSLRIQESSP